MPARRELRVGQLPLPPPARRAFQRAGAPDKGVARALVASDPRGAAEDHARRVRRFEDVVIVADGARRRVIAKRELVLQIAPADHLAHEFQQAELLVADRLHVDDLRADVDHPHPPQHHVVLPAG